MDQQLPHPQPTQKPGVLIAGAGIAGLMMAIFLEQIGFPYHIFERSDEVKPLGKKKNKDKSRALIPKWT
jgi:2-polyprenyl-6-methoxyphenol hydroxylase-like FAD-dependent oxidoreductase